MNYYGFMHISSGGEANNTTVNSMGFFYVSSGGVANSTTVNSCGRMSIDSGGMANSTTVNSCGRMSIDSGVVANNTTVNNGGSVAGFTNVGNNAVFIEKIADGKILSEINNLTYSGGLTLGSGGVANSTTVNSYGSMTLGFGGVANNTTMNGSMCISSGGVANYTVMNSGADMHISNGGVANNTTVNLSGQSISSGGVANNTTVNSRGYIFILNGGVANSTTVNCSGYMPISSGGVANNTIVNSGGHMSISSDGVASNTTVNSNGSMSIYNGGMANNTTVNSNGSMYLWSAGVASNTTVNYGAQIDYYGDNNRMSQTNLLLNAEATDRDFMIKTRNNTSFSITLDTLALQLDAAYARGIYALTDRYCNFAQTTFAVSIKGIGKSEYQLVATLAEGESFHAGAVSGILLRDETNDGLYLSVENTGISDGSSREKKSTDALLPEDAFGDLRREEIQHYELEEAPNWLKIDSANEEFSGTTGKIDNAGSSSTATGYGVTDVIVGATGSSGQTEKHKIELVVIPETVPGMALTTPEPAPGEPCNTVTDMIEFGVKNRKQKETFKLPFNAVELELFGLYFKGIDLSLTVRESQSTDYVFRLQGKFELKIIETTYASSLEEKPTITVDLAGDVDGEKYLELTVKEDFSGASWQIVGEMKFEHIVLGGGFFLEEGVLSVDMDTNTWSGEVTLKIADLDYEFILVEGENFKRCEDDF